MHRVNQVSEILGRIRVLYVAKYSTGGSIESLLCLISGLNKDVFDATVLFYSTPEPSIRRRVEAEGATIEDMDQSPDSQNSHEHPAGSGKTVVQHEQGVYHFLLSKVVCEGIQGGPQIFQKASERRLA